MWNVECKGTERTECGSGMEIYKKGGKVGKEWRVREKKNFLF